VTPGTVFLDRDGVLNRKAPEGDYITTSGEVEVLPGAPEALARLNAAGARVVVVTNQRGVARGRMTLSDLDAVNARLAALLAPGRWDALYSCPHEGGACDCRKPGTGLFEQARAADPAIDFADAAMVGDSPSDMQAGRALGLRTVLVGGERGGGELADAVVPDLAAAVDRLVRG